MLCRMPIRTLNTSHHNIDWSLCNAMLRRWRTPTGHRRAPCRGTKRCTFGAGSGSSRRRGRRLNCRATAASMSSMTAELGRSIARVFWWYKTKPGKFQTNFSLILIYSWDKFSFDVPVSGHCVDVVQRQQQSTCSLIWGCAVSLDGLFYWFASVMIGCNDCNQGLCSVNWHPSTFRHLFL